MTRGPARALTRQIAADCVAESKDSNSKIRIIVRFLIRISRRSLIIGLLIHPGKHARTRDV